MPNKLIKLLFDNAYILLLLTTLFWAGNFVLGRGVAGHVPPIALSWFRWIFAFLIIMPFTLSYVRKDWNVIKKNIPVLAMLGIFGVGSFNTLAYIGLNHTTAINALILQTSGPVLIMIGAYLALKEHVTPLQILGILLSIPGVVIIIARGDLSILSQMSLNIGDAWIVAAMISWAIYTILLRFRPNIHFLSLAFITFAIGALFVTPFFIAEIAAGKVIILDKTTALSVLYVSIFPSTLAYLFYNRGVELIGPNRAGAFLYVVPLFGAALAIALLGEQLKFYHAIGLGLIVAGVWLTSKQTGAKKVT